MSAPGNTFARECISAQGRAVRLLLLDEGTILYPHLQIKGTLVEPRKEAGEASDWIDAKIEIANQQRDAPELS